MSLYTLNKNINATLLFLLPVYTKEPFRVTTPAQDLHIQHVHLHDRPRPAAWTAAATIVLHNWRILAQTVRNRLREAHLHDRHPHWGRCNRLGWVSAHIRWCLARWHDHHLMLQHDNSGPHVARLCAQFLEAENIPVLAWPAYSTDMSPIEHVWDSLDQHIWQHVLVPVNIQQLHTAAEEEWTNIPQATINNLINSMRRRCVALSEANGGHTRYWLIFWPPPIKQNWTF